MRPLALAWLLLVAPALAAAQQSLASRQLHPPVADDVLAPRRRNPSQGVTFMIIGGAAVLVGAVAGGTGGTILIVGGFACAVYGFYLYAE